MPLPRRKMSDTSHVSDSEPEREARRRNESDNEHSLPPDSPSLQRTPLSSISNMFVETEPIGRCTLESRVSKLEGEMAEIKHELRALRRYSVF
jgi:hypothetical protein